MAEGISASSCRRTPTDRELETRAADEPRHPAAPRVAQARGEVRPMSADGVEALDQRLRKLEREIGEEERAIHRAVERRLSGRATRIAVPWPTLGLALGWIVGGAAWWSTGNDAFFVLFALLASTFAWFGRLFGELSGRGEEASHVPHE